MDKYGEDARNLLAVYVRTIDNTHECACWDYSIENRWRMFVKEIIHCFFYEVEEKMKVGSQDGLSRAVIVLDDSV